MARRLGKFQRITRSLRFRLTVGYALFFSVMLIGVGTLYRQKLAASLDAQIRDGLEQEWAAVKGYLRIENGRPIWYYDRDDPDESFIIERLRHVYVVADGHGKVLADAQGNLQVSGAYESIGRDTPAHIAAVLRSPLPQWEVRRSARGVPYLIRSGAIYDENNRMPYFVAVGRSLADNRHILEQFTWTYVTVIPLVILIGCLLGWFFAGRALTPVLEVAQAAQRISGSNLSLRIPSRGADDELDYLIETFNRMIDRLENSFNQIRQFSTDVSHELRTPITAIRGQLEVAIFTATNAEQYREAMLNSLQDVERLSQIVRALLLLSQAESGQLALQKIRVNLSELVADVVDQFQIPYEEARVRLTADLPDECSSRGRPDPNRAHDFQSALERHEVHPRGRRSAGHVFARMRTAWTWWFRIPAAALQPTSAAYFRPLLSGAGTGYVGPGTRPWTRIELRGLDCQGAWGKRTRGEHPGPGQPFYRVPAGVRARSNPG